MSQNLKKKWKKWRNSICKKYMRKYSSSTKITRKFQRWIPRVKKRNKETLCHSQREWKNLTFFFTRMGSKSEAIHFWITQIKIPETLSSTSSKVSIPLYFKKNILKEFSLMFKINWTNSMTKKMRKSLKRIVLSKSQKESLTNMGK